jgi:hypothetical protein
MVNPLSCIDVDACVMMVAMSLYCSHNVSLKELSEGGAFLQVALR